MKTIRILAIASMTFSACALVSLLLTQDFVVALSFIGCALVVEFAAFIQNN